jgi:hypothetical protein
LSRLTWDASSADGINGLSYASISSACANE